MKKEGDIELNMEVKAVLFDMDGVLVDSIHAWFHVVNDTLKHYGYKPFTFEYFKKNFGTSIEQDAKENYGNRNPKEIADFYNQRFRNRVNKVKLFKDALPALKLLKKRKI